MDFEVTTDVQSHVQVRLQQTDNESRNLFPCWLTNWNFRSHLLMNRITIQQGIKMERSTFHRQYH